MNTFDTNIQNYTREELIKEIFDLPENFDKDMVEQTENKWREKIQTDQSLTEKNKTELLEFLKQAKNLIVTANHDLSLLRKVVSNVHNANYELTPVNLEASNEHMIQNRPDKSYTSSFPGEFFPGVINPLKRRTLRSNLNIDTRFRENYYSTTASDFNIQLPININNVLDMQLAGMELPLTYYVISKQYGNNYFNIELINANGTFNEVIILQDGNYTQTTIFTLIHTELSNLSTIDPDFANILFTINLTNANTGTGQTIVGWNGSQSTGARFNLNFQANMNGNDDKSTPLPLKFGWKLGFRNGIYENNNNYVSEGVVDLTGPRYVYLVVDDHNNSVNNGFYNAAFTNSILNKNILARISLQTSVFNIYERDNFNIVTYPREYLGPVDIRTLTIQLLDEYGRILFLNNMDYSFALKMTVAYDV